MVKNLLKYLNFSEKESNVYLALLEVGQSKASDIAKKTNINRTTVYDLCESLMKKGLLSKYKKSSGTYFNALEPQKLLDYLDRE
ncbi:MAG: helix-turn-helix domain-containing protein, partial [Patescibacteria group bacterium]